VAELATYVQRERVRGWRAPAEGVLCTRTRPDAPCHVHDVLIPLVNDGRLP
jgi:hypothetical protein